MPFPTLDLTAKTLRGAVVEMSHRAGAPHLASSLSCIDILTVLYWKILRLDPKKPQDPDRDRFILSKGHAAAALYAALAHRGFYPAEDLKKYVVNESRFPEHPPAVGLPGVEAATGSLGHGLPMGLGMALAARILKKKYRVFVLLSDGECNEGSNWEAAMFAAGQKLSNVCVLVDYNKWQATGRSRDILAIHPLDKKWEACGWSTLEIDGHDHSGLTEVLSALPREDGKPTAIIAHTIKGKGISFMEDDNNWHYKIPSVAEVAAAKKELGLI
ncbi:MAG: transketolase [Deltaproteobacteria bacterium]|nr:transketolase [Deltaproteobacteria bacterium]MBI4223962.1 transketolase [Deltaproteobacteria bacterium]